MAWDRKALGIPHFLLVRSNRFTMAKGLEEMFRLKLGPEKVLTGDRVLERHHHIWHMGDPLNARAVLLPTNTQDVSEIMKICFENNQPVVVHGGLTNMVGSTETNADEVVISMERMSGIEEFDTKSRTMTVKAGTVLENVHNAAMEQNLFFPVTFGAKGSAQIGGAIATNAGGLRVFRYGLMRNSILGLEVVLADGTIVPSLRKLIKDNSGYDLKHVFIGSEGTLGIITKAVLRLIEAPRSVNSALVGCASYDQVLEFLKLMDGRMAGALSGFELLWKGTYIAMTQGSYVSNAPLPYDFDYYVLVETLGNDQEMDRAALQNSLEEALRLGLISDAVVAQSPQDHFRLWKIREDVDVLVAQCSHAQHFDISLPISEIDNYVNKVLPSLKNIPQVEKCFVYGHAADGNIHFMIGKSDESEALRKHVNDVIYGLLVSFGGSVSAEHGIGLHKKDYLYLTKSPEEIELMHSLKMAFDPKGILNRGKILEARNPLFAATAKAAPVQPVAGC